MITARPKGDLGKGANVALLYRHGVRPIGQKTWSLLPGDPPFFDGRTIGLQPYGGLAADIMAAVEHAAETGSDLVIWTASNRRLPICRSLNWGYTVFAAEGRLIAYQRVVFVAYKAHGIDGDPFDAFRVVEPYCVSSWNGMLPRKTDEGVAFLKSTAN